MPSIEYDIRYLQAGLVVIEDYLLVSELYWPIGASAPVGEPPFPLLTIGNLLLSQARLRARILSPGQQVDLVRLTQQMETARTRWRVAWEQKAKRGYHSRLTMWNNFLEEYREAPGANFDRYTYEVRLRVILHLLQPEAESIDKAEMDLLSGLDTLLRAILVPGEFLWEQELAGGFSPEEYWYLFGYLPERLATGSII